MCHPCIIHYQSSAQGKHGGDYGEPELRNAWYDLLEVGADLREVNRNLQYTFRKISCKDTYSVKTVLLLFTTENPDFLKNIHPSSYLVVSITSAFLSKLELK